VGSAVTAPGRPSTTIISVDASAQTAQLAVGWSTGPIQPVTITKNIANSDRYLLDAFGRPMRTDDRARSWLYGSGNKLLFSRDLTTSRLYLRLKGQLYATKVVDETNQRMPVDLGNTDLVNDPMGTALAQVAPNGVVTQQESTPFGEVISGAGWNATTPAQYQTQTRARGRSAIFFTIGDPFDMFDTTARMYSPSLGRYLSPDPKLAAIGRVLGHDRYGHALDDPNTYVDPDGRSPYEYDIKIDQPWWTFFIFTRSEWEVRVLGMDAQQYFAMFPERGKANLQAGWTAASAVGGAAGAVRATAGKAAPKSYRREWRAGLIRELENRQPRDTKTGQFVDLDSLELIPLGKEQVGHLPGVEHRRLSATAKRLNMSQREFTEWVNSNPDWFILQNKPVNESHGTEVPGNILLLPLGPEKSEPDRF
jgi:RHS repeat-associated protein